MTFLELHSGSPQKCEAEKVLDKKPNILPSVFTATSAAIGVRKCATRAEELNIRRMILAIPAVLDDIITQHKI